MRYDICIPRPKKDSDKPYWHRIGTMFAAEGKTTMIYFDSLPVPDSEGVVKAAVFEAKPKEGSTPVEQRQPERELDEEIPF